MARHAFEQFAAVRNYQDLSFSPDGKWIAYVCNVSGQLDVWRQPSHAGPDGHPGMPVQLTAYGDRSARRAAWSPDGTRILTQADRNGNENFQLEEIPAETGWPHALTDRPTARHELAESPFSPDGRLVAYGSNARNPADFDALVRDLHTGEVKTLLAGEANFAPTSWSPDGRHVLVTQFHSNTHQEVMLCDLATGENRALTAGAGEAIYTPGPWDADGRGFFLLSDRGRAFTGLAHMDAGTGELTWVDTPEWDVMDVAASRDGARLAWVVNEDGYSRLRLREGAGGAVRTVAGLPDGVYGRLAFSPTEPRLALYVGRAERPATIYTLDIESGRATALTQPYLGGVPESEMVAPELVRYPTHDGGQVPAYLYRPRGIAPGARAPVVLSIHGGPQSQELPTYAYFGFYQYLLSRGVGVLAPNIRGSTGYGRAYTECINRDWGGGELGDLEHAARYLRSLPWVDGARLGVFGGSFGGFATLSCITRLPAYWSAAVDIVGPSNLVTFTRAVPPFWRRSMKAWVGDPDEDAALLTERSPITYVDQVRAPLLVIQGANDPRVVKSESDQMVARLRELGRSVEYMVFEDEGHGFTKPANWLKALRASADWLLRHLDAE